MNEEQINNLESHAKAMIAAKANLKNNWDNFVREAQKIGYGVNPKTGKLNKL